jgi:3-oxoacyl-[acyl-carrier-protein] synthase-3
VGCLYLHGLGHFHPENVIDNRFLEDLDIGTTDEWILERVGIARRRTVLPLDYIRQTKNRDVRAAEEASLYANHETARRSALLALARAGLRPADIGLVVAGGCSPQTTTPAEACRVAAALDIDAPALDINSACSSFGAHLHWLRSHSDLPTYCLVVSPENTTRVVDYSDRTTAVLWGDGTSAAVVSNRVPSRVRVVATSLTSSPVGHGAVRIQRFGHFGQDGNSVQRFAIKTTTATLAALLPSARERTAQSGGRVRFIGHQANATMLDAVARRAQFDPIDHWSNIAEYGNTGAAGAPTVLSQHWDALADRDTVLMVVVGAGLTWASATIEIGES